MLLLLVFACVFRVVDTVFGVLIWCCADLGFVGGSVGWVLCFWFVT